MNNYILGSHNSWSYLPPKHWWLRPFTFMARCQSADIKTQYEKYGVRCFDLRILYDSHGQSYIAHGFMKYKYSYGDLLDDLQWLNDKRDCYIRVLHEARRKSQYTNQSRTLFRSYCLFFVTKYQNIHWWCGRNLYNWEYDYDFTVPTNSVGGFPEPTCEENYSSVMPPKWLDDWFPWLYAKLNNRKILSKGTDKDILLIDFVNIK